jgi:hypothetical protein
VVDEVLDVQPVSPDEQPTVEEPVWTIVQLIVEPQVPGQDEPQARGPGLKYPPSPEAPGQDESYSVRVHVPYGLATVAW